MAVRGSGGLGMADGGWGGAPGGNRLAGAAGTSSLGEPRGTQSCKQGRGV